MPTTNDTIRCLSCGEEHPVEDMTAVSGGYVCDECRNEHYGICDRCGEWVLGDEMTEINGGREYWCVECTNNHAVECDHCGHMFTNRYLNWSRSQGDSLDICSDCSDYYWRCNDCGEIIHEDGAYYDDETDGHYCSGCWEHLQLTRERGIRNYSYKPAPDFAFRGREDSATTHCYGIELEVDIVNDVSYEDANDTAAEITDMAEGRLYCKHDGSLDEGFEIVSHPASLAYHMYQFRWANILRTVSKAGFRSHETETCGLHIHVGRSTLGSTGLNQRIAAGNLVILAQVLKEPLTKFSRRKADRLARWAAFSSLNLNPSLSDTELTNAALGTYAYGRYQAVNLQNSATVEFRIFRGTLKRDTLIASLQLVDNLCQYAMTHTPSQCLTATYADIVNVKPWDELVSYSRNKRLITEVTTAVS